MSVRTTGLDLIQIASPCPVSWNEMRGDERVRHCSQCQQNVYNLREMTRAEADAFVRTREGRTCIQLYRRHDGTVLTKDCPVGLAAVKRRFYRSLAAIAALLAALIAGPWFGKALDQRLAQRIRTPLDAFAHWIDPSPMVIGGMMLLPPGAYGKLPPAPLAALREAGIKPTTCESP